MIFHPTKIQDNFGRTIILRNAETSDAAALIQYLKTTTAETPYLLREPEEVCLTVEQEETFITNMKENPRELMLCAFLNSEHIGNCSMSAVGTYGRYAHRCEIAIALYQKYCGIGIGKKMLTTVLKAAKEAGYEQAELEVIQTNGKAIHLYQKLGFQTYGRFPDNMKYADGTYADALWMMKKL